MASFAFGRTLLQLAGRLGLKPSDLSKVDDIAFVGTGNKNLLTNTRLDPRVIGANFKNKTDLLDDQFMNLRSSVTLFQKGKLNPLEERMLMDNISDLVTFKETGKLLPKGGIITTESFRDLGRRGASGKEFAELGKRLARQKKNRFPGNVTPEVKSALKEIDNQIVASGQITMKDFAKLSEIEKNRIRRIFDPELEAKFPFLKFAEGGRVHLASGTSPNVLKPARKAYNSVYGYDAAGNEILVKDLFDDFGSFLEMFRMQYHADGGIVSLNKPKRGLVDEPGSYAGEATFPSDVVDSRLLDIGFDNLSLDEINDLLKSIGVDTKAEGGMIKDKGLANILAV